MASQIRIHGRADRGFLARIGLGVARKVGQGRVAHLTVANRSGTNAVPGETPRHERVSASLGEAPEVVGRRRDRPAHVSGESVAVDPQAFDLMARAGDVAHGVAGFGPYAPGTRRHETQCEREAGNAVAVLDGLNVVADDLVDAALLGMTARTALRAGAAYDEARCMGALARLALRALADGCETEGEVEARVAAFVGTLRLTADEIGVPATRTRESA